MRYIVHPQPREITLSNGQKIPATFKELFVGHIDSMSAAFGKSFKLLRLAVKAIDAVQKTKPGQTIELEEDVYEVVRECFDTPEKFGAAMHVHTWRHLMDWIEAILNATDKLSAIADKPTSKTKKD